MFDNKIKELREKHNTLREQYPVTGPDHKGRTTPRNRKLGELTEMQELQSQLIDALCEKVFK